MRKKTNKFLVFMFSLLPGAGHMFMGFMKTGVSLMSAFLFVIFLTAWLIVRDGHVRRGINNKAFAGVRKDLLREFIPMKIDSQNVHRQDERFCNMCIVAVNKFLITKFDIKKHTLSGYAATMKHCWSRVKGQVGQVVKSVKS